MRVIAVPVKALPRSKSRLAGVLSEDERAELTLALLEDVLSASLALDAWETWVISRDERVRRAASSRGARPVEEVGASLRGAVRQVEALMPGRKAELAVVLGDLPWLTPGEIEDAVGNDGSVVAAPAVSDGGTNLLLRRPPTVIPSRFGRASFAKHRWEARRVGAELVEVRGPGLERDVDTPADLVRVLESPLRSRTRSTCLQMGLAERLLARAARR